MDTEAQIVMVGAHVAAQMGITEDDRWHIGGTTGSDRGGSGVSDWTRYAESGIALLASGNEHISSVEECADTWTRQLVDRHDGK